jgi:hypothetical protein
MRENFRENLILTFSLGEKEHVLSPMSYAKATFTNPAAGFLPEPAGHSFSRDETA